MEPKLSLNEVKEIVAAKVHPKVTEDSIKAKIESVDYHWVGEDYTGTVCIITMKNGWVSTGFSKSVDVRNHDEEVGKRYAYENAFKQLWQLEGYLLRSQLAEGK